MTSVRWSDEMLDAKRLVGDAPADAAIEAILEGGGSPRTHIGERVANLNRTFMTHLMTNGAPLPSSLSRPLREFLETTTVKHSPDPSIVEAAQALFVDHGPEILTTLGCYALPDAYAARKGVKVLHQTAYLANRPNRRLFRTMQMVIDVMGPGGLDPDGRGIRTVQKVRLMHAAIRYQLTHDPSSTWDMALGIPINQEDLAGTLLTFSFLAIDGIRKLGANISEEAATAYFDTWCWVGQILGVLPEMIPDNLNEAAELKAIISGRQFEPSDEGREMTQALIKMLEKNSPPLLEGVPVGLMRLFLEQEVADYLGVPDSEFDKHLGRMVVSVAKFIDRDLEIYHWHAMIFRRHILALIEYMIKVEAGSERDFFRIPAELHNRWHGPNPKSEEGLWGHLADWIVARV
jgi:uncharacterized protein (DUF2236 family)